MPVATGAVTLTVYDATGRLVAGSNCQVANGIVSQELATLPAGLYQVEARDGQTRLGSARFVKE